jgi:protein-tyrosine phosphatase
MIDIHSHVLPGLDDGAETMEQTIAMLEIARAAGTSAIVATPHANTQYRFDPARVDDLIAQAQARIGNGITLHRGCDFHLMFDNVNDALQHPARYTINGRAYLLVELSDLVIFPNTGDLFDRLEQHGMRIIVTHPERNPLLQQRIELIAEWVSKGRYMQLTAQSLAGRFGPRARSFARLLLDRGLVHFIASDAHDTQSRPPRLDEACAWVRDAYGESLAKRLFITHPAAALEGDELDLAGFPPPKQAKETNKGLIARLFRKES